MALQVSVLHLGSALICCMTLNMSLYLLKPQFPLVGKMQVIIPSLQGFVNIN